MTIDSDFPPRFNMDDLPSSESDSTPGEEGASYSNQKNENFQGGDYFDISGNEIIYTFHPQVNSFSAELLEFRSNTIGYFKAACRWADYADRLLSSNIKKYGVRCQETGVLANRLKEDLMKKMESYNKRSGKIYELMLYNKIPMEIMEGEFMGYSEALRTQFKVLQKKIEYFNRLKEQEE